jgi:hypothetical protein
MLVSSPAPSFANPLPPPTHTPSYPPSPPPTHTLLRPPPHTHTHLLPTQALADGGTKLWVSTTSSTVHGYNIPASITGQQQQQQPRQQPRRQQQQWDQPPHSPTSASPDPQGSANCLNPAAADGLNPGAVDDLNPDAATAAGAVAGFSGRGLGTSGAGWHVFGASPSLRLRHSLDPAGHAEDVPLVSPSVVVQGSPGLVAVRVLVDKRHVLTQVRVWCVGGDWGGGVGGVLQFGVHVGVAAAVVH